MKRILQLGCFLVMAFALMAQGSISPKTQVYLKNQASEKAKKHYSYALSANDNVERIAVYIHFDGGIDTEALQEHGVKVLSVYEKIGVVSALVPTAQVDVVSEIDGVRYVEMIAPTRLNMEKAREVCHVDEVHEALSPLTHAYKGSGVVVGIVDAGIQYTHPAFMDNTMTRSRVVSVWDQTGYGAAPADFSYGTEYKTEAEIKRADYDGVDEASGHGTHTTSIAAGGDCGGRTSNYGIASDADLVLVSCDMGPNFTFTPADAVDYVFKKADALGKPAVVNLSLGTHEGPHDGTSTVDRIFSSISGPGRIIVGAAGNEGDIPLHIGKEFSDADTLLRTMIRCDSWYGPSYNIIDFWMDSACDAQVQLVVYNRTSKKMLYESDTFTMAQLKAGVAENIDIDEVVDGGWISADLDMVSEVNPFNEKTNLVLSVNSIGRMPSSAALGLVFVGTKGSLNGWSDGEVYFSNYGQRDWSDGSVSMTAGEVGGTGRTTVSAGAYIVEGYGTYRTGTMAGFSSHGPTADGRTKPEIAAPGFNVVAAIPANVRYMNDIAETIAIDGKKYYYAYMSGTSMAAPFATGVIATWLQANPRLSYADIIDVFEHTAIHTEKIGAAYPNNISGNGLINAYGGLLYVLGLSTSVENEDMPSVMMAYPNPTYGEFAIGFARNDRNVVVRVYDLDGKELLATAVGETVRGSEREFSLSGLNGGVYVVRVVGDKYNETFRLIKK